MNLEGADIKPAEGMLLVRFVDDDDDDEDRDSSPNIEVGAMTEPSESPYEGCLAIVVAAGPKVTFKKGATVITTQWARDGMRVGPGLRMIRAYEVVGELID